MTEQPPKVVVLAGPNGAGKTTYAAKFLSDTSIDFINADVIAKELSDSSPESVAFEAGRVMLTRMKELAANGASFAIETTLATRSYAPWLRSLQASGYAVHLLFLWLPSADMAVARVADRVQAGGHNIPEPTIRRRYAAGLRNLRSLYLPLANSWQVFDNTDIAEPLPIAAGLPDGLSRVYLREAWQSIMTRKE